MQIVSTTQLDGPRTWTEIVVWTFVCLLGCGTASLGAGCTADPACAGPACSTTDAGVDASESDSGQNDGGSPALALSGVCDFASQKICAWQARCLSVDQAECESRLNDTECRTRFERYEAAVVDGRVIFDAELAQDCYTQYDSLACEARIDETPCRGFLAGQASLGDSCRGTVDRDECADGYCRTGAACPGTCVTYALLGESCNLESDLRCDDGLICDTGMCRPLPGLTEPCFDGFRCAEGLECVFGEVCGMRLPPGNSCRGPGDCQRGTCADGICQDFPGLGEPCDFVCNVGACPSGGGVCQPLAELGTACEPGGCVSDAFCSGGRCASYPSVGESCAESFACEDGAYCGTGERCEAARPESASCAESNQCLSRRCERGSCVPSTGACPI